MKVHELKVFKKYVHPLIMGDKTFEIRKNDRGFQKGDILHMKEIENGSKEYTGFEMFLKVIYIHQGLGLEDGYVCMSVKRIDFKLI